MVLKIVAAGSHRAPYSQLAGELVMSSSEVHASVKRAEVASLLHGKELHNRANLAALEELLVHGLKPQVRFPRRTGRADSGHPDLVRRRAPPASHCAEQGTCAGLALEGRHGARHSV